MKFDEAQEFPRALVAKAAAQGYYGVLFPESLGGAGLGYIEYVTVVEELSRVDGSIGISVAAHNSLCTNHVYACGERRAAKEVRAEARLGGVDRRLEPDRADRRQRRGRNEDHAPSPARAAAGS